MSNFTIADKVKCAAREVGMRSRVYPDRVKKLKMKQETADHELAVMSEIAKDYVLLEALGPEIDRLKKERELLLQVGAAVTAIAVEMIDIVGADSDDEKVLRAREVMAKAAQLFVERVESLAP